ncbi:MAG: hypothetical protein JWN75_1197 [Candidatus Saccharibacteria bacterium]|nr:hypothetical protein [Candidatus Saccharibacteria bacterium]
MDKPITLGLVLWVVGGGLGFVVLIGLLWFVIDLMNPFRSGH